MLTRMMVMLMACAVAGAAGCREKEPTPPYNRNLASSDGGRRLLPIARTVAGSRDPSINDNAKATIIRRDEMDTPEAAEMVSGAPTAAAEDITTADTPGEALANVGKAFLGNLMGKTIPPVDGTTPDGASGGGATGDAGGAGDSGLREVEVRSVIAEFATELAAGRYTKLAAFCASSQSQEAGFYYDTLDEMNTSLSSLLAAYEKSSPGVKSKFEQELSKKRAAFVVNNVVVDGSSATVNAASSEGSDFSFSIVQEDGSWRIRNGIFADASAWAAMKDAMEAHVVAIDDEVDELSGDEEERSAPDSGKLDKLIEEAIEYLSAKPK